MAAVFNAIEGSLKWTAGGLLASQKAIQNGVVGVANYAGKHPVQTVIVAGSVAALAVGAVLTGGVDLAAAPEILTAEIGTDSAVAAASDVGAVGADTVAADAGTNLSISAAEESSGPSLLSRAGSLTKGAGNAVKGIVSSTPFKIAALGGGIAVGGYAAGFGLKAVSGGINDIGQAAGQAAYNAVTGLTTALGLPQQAPPSFIGTNAPSAVPGSSINYSQGSPQPSLLSKAEPFILIGGAAVLVYLLFFRK